MNQNLKRLLAQDDGWLPCATIPNQAGFLVSVKKLSGEIIDTAVSVGPDQCHFLVGVPNILEVAGWKARKI